MEHGQVSEFGGIAGRVAREAMSPGTLVTGLGLALLLGTISFIFLRLEMSALATFLSHVVGALALARFALNGLAGEFRGTIFSTAGGSWVRAARVAARYLVLNSAWIVPALLLKGSAGQDAMALVAGAGSGKVLVLAALLVFGIALSPPVCLIVSARAEKMGDILSPAFWGGCFRGRLSDLYVVYVVYIGGLATLLVISLPALALAFGGGVNLGLSVLAAELAFGMGLAITLLGRLCGFYAFGGESAEAPAGAAFSAPPPSSAPRAAAGTAGTVPAAAGRTPTGVQASPGAHVHPAAHGPSLAAAEPAPAGASVKPPLLEATQRVEEARRRFKEDPRGAIGVLQELRASYAPSPQVLHALVLAHHAAGQEEQAVEAAREAFPLCLRRGNLVLAAEMFRALLRHVPVLGIGRDDILVVGATFIKMGDLRGAANAYVLLFRMDPGERRAVKGLLQIADLHLRPQGAAAEAVKIYRFLLEKCPASPFADDMRRGLAEAERRLVRAS
jgi:hypothetical protein